MKKCPFCSEEIQEEAIKCKHCKKLLESENEGEIKQLSKLNIWATNKSYFLLPILMLMICVISITALNKINKIEYELQEILTKDFELKEKVMSVVQIQLEKTVLFERMIRISEEVGYEDVTPERKKHLIDHSQLVKKGFDELSQKGIVKIVEGKKLIQDRFSGIKPQASRNVQKTKEFLLRIEQTHIQYDDLVGKILESVKTGKYQVSFEDIKRIRQIESDLNEQLELLNKEIDETKKDSELRVSGNMETTRRILWSIVIFNCFMFIGAVFILLKRGLFL